MVLKNYREEAGVTTEHSYYFAVRCTDRNTIRTLNACKLIAKYSEICGATNPKTLRCTGLRK